MLVIEGWDNFGAVPSESKPNFREKVTKQVKLDILRGYCMVVDGERN